MPFRLSFIALIFFILSSQCCECKKSALKITKITKKTKSKDNVVDAIVDTCDPFLELTEFLLRTASSAAKSTKSKKLQSYSIKDYPKRRVHRILKQLSQSQSAVKSFDGATHSLGNALTDKSSLDARVNKFLDTSKPKKKEAAKVIEYITAVERSLQAAEILQATAQSNDTLRHSLLQEAGLEEIKRFHIIENKVRLLVSILRPDNTINHHISSNASPKAERRRIHSMPKKYAEKEMIVAITEADEQEVALFKLMRVLAQPAATCALAASGFVNEEVMIQATILSLAWKVLGGLYEHILPPIINQDKIESMDADHISTEDVSSKHDMTNNITSSPAPTIIYDYLPSRIRFVGYSAGGAVASIASMLLEGSLNLTSPSNITSSTMNDSRSIGSYRNRVRCISLAAPPVISRSIVSRHITATICGDDIIPRSYSESIQSLYDRVGKILVSGGGRGGFASWTAGGSWLKDLSNVAMNGVQQYAAGSHDVNTLSVAGRVFYIKARKHKEGATIQRVMRGNWKEDMIWLLHEILLSAKMIKHHSLEYYIQTLARC